MPPVAKSPGSLFINLLGGFRAAGPRETDLLQLERKRTRALLAMLSPLEPAQTLPRGKLTAVLWSELGEDAARHGLRQCLLELRHALERLDGEVIRADAEEIGLDIRRLVVDVVRFEACVARGTSDALEEAVALYRGDLLEGFSLDERAFEDWLQLERERLRSRAVEAFRKLLAHHSRDGVTDAGIQIALRLLAIEPFDEAAHRTLMRLYAESGRRTAALRHYEACVEILARELGVEPEDETRELYRRLVSKRDHAVRMPANVGPRRPTARKARVPVPAEAASSTPLVGRESEREWLEDLCNAAHGGSPQLGLVLGEAGIGKSRLLAGLMSYAQERRSLILLGRGREGEAVLPFAPWMEALRPTLGVDVLGRLAPTTRQDLARLFPETADRPGLPPSGLEDGLRIFEAVAHLLREVATRRRLVVVIEDLHWCDDMTVRLLRFLPRRLEGRSVLLLGTARQEELPAGRGASLDTLRQDASCVARTLGPLSRDEATHLFHAFLASQVGAPSAGIVERVWRLSEGNPFVVIECARAERDRGAGPDHPSLGLPDQVRALTARSLGNLSDLASRLTDVAAVIGRDFDVMVLRQAATLSDLELAEGVEELVRRRVLREVDGRFDFSHDRVREVAYARLLGPRRALLHRQVAEALEAVYAAQLDPHRARIGAHYREAGVWDRASTYLARAGFQAWERGAGREALACFEDALQAITRLPDTEERRELHVHLRIAANGAHVATGSYERGRPHLLAAETLAATLSDRRWQARVAAALCNSLRAGGAHHDAIRVGRRALDIAREIADRRLESVATLVLGAAEHSIGSFRPSRACLLPLLHDDVPASDLTGPFLSQVDGSQSLRAAARHWIVLSCVELGEFAAGLRLVDEWLRETDAVGDPLRTSRLMAYISRGRIENAMGDFDAAVL